MSGSSLVASQCGCLIAGIAFGFWFNTGHIQCHCPDCVVNLSCPAASCTTGSIELSLSAILGLAFSIAVLYLFALFIYHSWPVRDPEVRAKPGAFDGRRAPLGTASSRRPITGNFVLKYDIAGDPTSHSRLLIGHVTKGEWIILTPQGDIYAEDLSPDNMDIYDWRAFDPNVGVPYGIDPRHVHDFNPRLVHASHERL